MVLEQELFRQIALQKEELFRLVISNEQYKNCNNNGKATENVKKFFFTTVCLPCNSILPYGCVCFIVHADCVVKNIIGLTRTIHAYLRGQMSA